MLTYREFILAVQLVDSSTHKVMVMMSLDG